LVVKAIDLHPANLDSTAAGTHRSHWWQRGATSQKWSCGHIRTLQQGSQ